MKIFKFWSPYESGCTLYFSSKPTKKQTLEVLMKKYNEAIGNNELSAKFGTAYEAVKRSETRLDDLAPTYENNLFDEFFQELELIKI